ncbi:O-antigen ligase [Flavobacterium sp. GT3R68]|uniref:O-antigen ligase family protein n=1 Tax=Flavobacterium sp. GT3R68 TaxID=2594437 RepID=UPI000F88502B|nr:O-antigen ligase family protein [Flavobacterium sp. GT3R68]RTY95921.1 O-antigen ligase domain-containing protein [Flavobacterium sp. GSN2]TRW93693.1 O-antigen ligase family protein [Flavobacterium sp. GT3R68]
MANTYNYLKTVFQELQQESKNHSSLLFILLVLLTIPLSYAVNSISLGLLLIVTLITFKKTNFKVDIYLYLPILLYVLMAISVLWSIDKPSSIASLSKELPLLLIPLCFLLFKELSPEQKRKIIRFYSFGILLFVLFYFTKAFIRFAFTGDSSVFFYHELVTKDVNAIHVSVYVAMAFFYFFTKTNKSVIDIIAIGLLLAMVFLLSSKNIIVVFIGLMICYHLFYSKISKKMRLKNLIIFIIFLFSLTFVGKIKDRFKEEYETIMTDSSVNDVISKESGPVYNVSIKQAWTNTTFQPNDYFPGTAFRVYQMRIFLEMLQEDGIFFTGYGLNASYPKIAAKGVQYNLFLGDETQQGYQTKNFHNQYIQNFAELGIFGLVILLTMLFVNIKNALKTKDFIHISFAVLMISLFLTESFLWRQRGVMFFTAMYCLFNSGFIPIAPKKE